MDDTTKKLIDKKLERLAELKETIDAAYLEISLLMGDTQITTANSDAIAPIVPPQKLNKHFVSSPARKMPKKEPCTECSSRGTRHYKGCSKDGVYTKKVLGVGEQNDTGSHGPSILDEPKKITAADWKDMKESYDDGVAPDMLKLSYPQYDPTEIRKAVKCETYDDYTI